MYLWFCSGLQRCVSVVIVGDVEGLKGVETKTSTCVIFFVKKKVLLPTQNPYWLLRAYSLVLLILEAVTASLDISSGKQKLAILVDTKWRMTQLIEGSSRFRIPPLFSETCLLLA